MAYYITSDGKKHTINNILTYLFVNGKNIIKLDLSGMDRLKGISCIDNQLTEIDLSICPTLEWLTCFRNQLTHLDITKNPNLQSIACDNESIDINTLTQVKYVYLHIN